MWWPEVMLKGHQTFIKSHQKQWSGGNWWKANQMEISIVRKNKIQRKNRQRRDLNIQRWIACDNTRRIKSLEHKWKSIQWLTAFQESFSDSSPRIKLHLKAPPIPLSSESHLQPKLCSSTSHSSSISSVASGHKETDHGSWISLPCCPTREHVWTTPQILPAKGCFSPSNPLVAMRNIYPLGGFPDFPFP